MLKRGQVGWITVFQSALEKVKEAGRPLTGADIFKAESETFLIQDLTVTMPITNEEEVKFSSPETPGVISIGSPIDDGALEPLQKPKSKGEPFETEPTGLPNTVIEIAQNEQEMEEILTAS